MGELATVDYNPPCSFRRHSHRRIPIEHQLAADTNEEIQLTALLDAVKNTVYIHAWCLIFLPQWGTMATTLGSGRRMVNCVGVPNGGRESDGDIDGDM